ncbi:hypothetical protein BD626DRAFT_410531 [Schizophyllum amplum]|uniref:Uncharacterized protein n=1 Tax=Schizophyllum amplum TaxID=97359 RepID=A0A550BRR5_9AGAR|nr:hypothetical protein BD626DRAFT_419797 [Auriculariopsis ampla]TRM58448.1 hypothetical protein BD626DRAFT_410531 [Auriculariopsis ampla]
MGYRPHGYSFNQLDYGLYVRRVRQFLTGLRGRTAILKGGLIARIAREFDADEEPSLDTGRRQQHDDDERVVCTLKDGRVFSDDCLTLQEERLLCGFFFVPNGNNTFKHLSLWPSHEMLLDSGWFNGIWTHDNECWYQKHFAEIRSFTFTGRTASEWKSALRFASKAGRMHRGGCLLAERYMSEHEDMYRPI